MTGDSLMTRTTRVLLSLAMLAMLAGAAFSASAEDYPSRTVEVVVPFPAGGGTEIVTRLVADGLSKRLGQAFVVLNRPGANTNLGTLSVVRSRPDGYSLLITSFGLAANPSLYKNLGFEPLVDLEPITLVANSPTVLTVPLALPAEMPGRDLMLLAAFAAIFVTVILQGSTLGWVIRLVNPQDLDPPAPVRLPAAEAAMTRARLARGAEERRRRVARRGARRATCPATRPATRPAASPLDEVRHL